MCIIYHICLHHMTKVLRSKLKCRLLCITVYHPQRHLEIFKAFCTQWAAAANTVWGYKSDSIMKLQHFSAIHTRCFSQTFIYRSILVHTDSVRHEGIHNSASCWAFLFLFFDTRLYSGLKRTINAGDISTLLQATMSHYPGMDYFPYNIIPPSFIPSIPRWFRHDGSFCFLQENTSLFLIV